MRDATKLTSWKLHWLNRKTVATISPHTIHRLLWIFFTQRTQITPPWNLLAKRYDVNYLRKIISGAYENTIYEMYILLQWSNTTQSCIKRTYTKNSTLLYECTRIILRFTLTKWKLETRIHKDDHPVREFPENWYKNCQH